MPKTIPMETAVRQSEGHDKQGRARWPFTAACVLLAAFAFWFNWATGHRGFFILDQSMVFDGAWRILQGQIPYKDLYFPFGPVTFYIQAFFFWIFGVNWTATVIPACLCNMVATLTVIRLVRLLAGGPRVLALLAGLATAICFQAPFGTLWLEQTAMFFDLLALLAVVESLHTGGRRRVVLLVAGGLSLALAILSKQNFGLPFAPLVFAIPAVALLPDLRRAFGSLVPVACGLAAGLLVFVIWLWAFSDPASFVQRALVVAGEIGRERMATKSMSFLFLFPSPSRRYQYDLIALAAGGIALAFVCLNLRKPAWRRWGPAAFTASYLPMFRNVSQATTGNNWENNFAYAGLATALGVILGMKLIDELRARFGLPGAVFVKVACLALAASWSTVGMAHETSAAWGRVVQEFFPGAQFTEPVRIPGMERLMWGEPTLLHHGSKISLRDFEGVAAYLGAQHRNFFIMGDATVLYGLLRVPSPQPMLYFIASHSYLTREIPRLDEAVVSMLERNRVEIVIREKVTYDDRVRDSYPAFPRTWGWFTSGFQHVQDFGIYEVWKRRLDSAK